MPPRIPILSALRQSSSLLRPQTASISTTKPTKALRDLGATSQLLNIDAPSPSNRNATQAASDIYDNLRGTMERQTSIRDEMFQSNHDDQYSRQLTRRWKVGDVYAPHDISASEMNKWRRNQSRKKDLVDMLGLRPLDMYRNFSVISEFMTPHGRIKRAIDTGLRPPNQRKLAKAIRRAIGLGIHPSVHRHPEILIRERLRYSEQNSVTAKRNHTLF
ncbi:ribosomal protein S18 [Jackrogersella minutella]|nr:ribosomal protein S18 [Jackrogersella minutella]